MIPELYKANATNFKKAGLGQLSRVIDCKVREGLNGAFELNLEMLRDDPLMPSIEIGAMIVAKPNQTQGKQPFVIEQINKGIDGVISIYATHIGQYRAKLIPIRPFTSTSLADTLSKISEYATERCDFTFYTDKSSSSGYSIVEPRSLRELLGGKEGSILDIYGGELLFDNYDVYLFNKRGRKSENINIVYGDNMIEYMQEDVFSWVRSITGVFPYYYKKDQDSDIYIQGNTQYSEYLKYYNYRKSIPMNFADKFPDAVPTRAQINDAAREYIKNRGLPQINIEASFEDITTLPLYNPIKSQIDVLQLGDYVNVINNVYNVNITTRIRELVYDVLLERYSTIRIGDATVTINDAINDAVDRSDNYYEASVLDEVKVVGTALPITNKAVNFTGTQLEALANDLNSSTETPIDQTYLITSGNTSGTLNKFFRRPISALLTYLADKFTNTSAMTSTSNMTAVVTPSSRYGHHGVLEKFGRMCTLGIHCSYSSSYTTATKIGTLPAGYFPRIQHTINLIPNANLSANANMPYLTINTDGEVLLGNYTSGTGLRAIITFVTKV